MLKHSDDYNVLNDIKLLLQNIPDNVTDLEKIRWLYIKFGQLFSYDFYVANDYDVDTKELDYNNIGRYQTCIQIVKILNDALLNINPTVKTKIIERKIESRGLYHKNHVATDLEFTDSVTNIKYKLLLDLTLDLYRIQGNLKTNQFGFSTDDQSTYDIISLTECKKMDTNLGFIGLIPYTDDTIKKVKDYIDNSNFDLNEKIRFIWENLSQKFYGSQEAKLYFNHLIIEILDIPFKEYNLTSDTNNGYDLITAYYFENPELIYILSYKNGLMKTTKENLLKMLNNGWKTNSKSLEDRLKGITNGISKR